ncbi:MAG: sugar transferase [SAR324 cluster bacterium]|nr:sugar transferase [SAR324 cluster bacterium]
MNSLINSVSSISYVSAPSSAFINSEYGTLALSPLDIPQMENTHEKVAGPTISRNILVVKRLMDIVGALVAILLFSPVMLLMAILVKLTSKGQILYRQTRVGYNGEMFEMIKFRSMRVNAEQHCGAIWAEEGKNEVDPRVTPIGNFLRKSHFDELPQLFLILSGRMSLVGPRPERPEFTSNLGQEFLFYNERFNQLKPGLTGIAQMLREFDESLKDTDKKLMADHSYGIMLSSMGFFEYLVLEIKIILMTVIGIIRR